MDLFLILLTCKRKIKSEELNLPSSKYSRAWLGSRQFTPPQLFKFIRAWHRGELETAEEPCWSRQGTAHLKPHQQAKHLQN